MKTVKIIPCLDMKDGRVVKGVNFVDFKDAGDPVIIAEYYCHAGADELVFLDISATAENRGTMLDVLKRTAEKVSVPLAVGGGISSIEDFEKVFEAGADKCSINSAAVNNPELINEASEKFGKEKVVVAIDAERNDKGGYDVCINGGMRNTGKDAVEWAKEAEKRGAGEILLTSVDADGTKDGYDIEMLKAITGAVSIPVTASGGAGKLEHFYDAVTEGGASATLAASLFHFNELEVTEVKRYLKDKGVNVNL